MFCRRKRETCALICGILFLVLGFFLLIFWENILNKLVSKKFEISKNSKTYEPWVKSGVPIYVQYYFFNWTNPGNLKNLSYKPEFTEVGPYKFWEKIEKVNVTWNTNGTVTYRRIRRWYFDPEGSKGSLKDRITTINTISLMAALMVKKLPILTRLSMNMMIASTQQIPVTRTVSEFLYEGYLDPLLTAGRTWPQTSSKVPYDRFGWFYQRNGSSTFDGTYNAFTGKTGMNSFGSMASWNYKNKTGFYPGACGAVKGSAGEFWPWKSTRDKSIYLFSPDLCRYIEYKYTEDVTVDGIDGYKYVTDKDLFDNGTSDPRNGCFCNGQCLASGVLNISVCRFGAPVFTSYPHFYLADPVYREAVVGMKPNKDVHENYILLEPEFGMPMDIAARIQINVLVQPNPFLALLDGVKQIVFPVFWLDQRVLVPAEKLHVVNLLKKLPTINFIMSIVFLILGSLCLLMFVRHKFSCKKKGVEITKNRNENVRHRNLGLPPDNEKPLLKGNELITTEIKSIKRLSMSDL